MTVPYKTIAIVGHGQMAATSEAFKDKLLDDFALSGNDLRDLAVLALRLNSRMIDGDELRDWQIRLNAMITSALANGRLT